MATEIIKQLLEAGVHFGHQAKRWNPKMAQFIFGQRSGIYIVNLEKTVDCLNAARDFLLNLATQGKSLLFVGTKKQAQEIIEKEARRCGMYWVNNRWLGGLLTNFSTIKKSINRLKEIEQMKQDGTFQKLTKKEVSRLEKEMEKLKKNFSGIVNMEGLPSCLFVVDTKKEEIAVKEALRLAIPVVALIDTNSNPDIIDYPIPGNDDAMKSIGLITSLIADTVMEGRKKFLEYLSKEGVAVEKTDKENISPPVEEEAGEAVEQIEEKLIEKKDKQEEKAPKRIRKEGKKSSPRKERT